MKDAAILTDEEKNQVYDLAARVKHIAGFLANLDAGLLPMRGAHEADLSLVNDLADIAYTSANKILGLVGDGESRWMEQDKRETISAEDQEQLNEIFAEA